MNCFNVPSFKHLNKMHYIFDLYTCCLSDLFRQTFSTFAGRLSYTSYMATTLGDWIVSVQHCIDKTCPLSYDSNRHTYKYSFSMAHSVDYFIVLCRVCLTYRWRCSEVVCWRFVADCRKEHTVIVALQYVVGGGHLFCFECLCHRVWFITIYQDGCHCGPEDLQLSV